MICCDECGAMPFDDDVCDECGAILIGSEGDPDGATSVETRRFHLCDVLSVTTGTMVSPRLMDGVRDVIRFMCGGEVYTNQLGVASFACRLALLAQHPALADVENPAGGTVTDTASAARWVGGVAARHRLPAQLDVAPLPDGAFRRWGHAEAVEDMADRVGAGNVYAADPSDPGSAAEVTKMIDLKVRGGHR